jgi:phenylacetate-CoA ligase
VGGEPRAIAHDPAAVLANAAHGERERSIVVRHVGRTAGYREAVLAPPISAVQEFQEFVRRRTVLPDRLRVQRSYFPLIDDPGEVARRLITYRPHVIHGFGSYVAAVCRHLARAGSELPSLRVVTYSSDPMSPEDRALIGEWSGAPVLATYQAVEALKIGFECGEGEGLHVNVDLYPARIVDEEGRDAPPGTPGSVVVSNLVNRATVLIEYRLGDRATILQGACACGRNLPRMSLPLGREEEWIALSGGGRMHAQAIRNLLSNEEAIRQYQVVQEGPRQFTVALVGAPGVDREAAAGRVIGKLAERLGQDAEIAVGWVGAIEKTPGGKARPIVRRWG